MTSDLDDLDDPEQRLCEVLAAYFEAVKAGQAPDRQDWLARHPDLADQLAQFLEQQDRLLRMTEPLRTITEASGRCVSDAVGPLPYDERASRGDPGAAASNFGDYELQREIARGGMGVVYRARQISLDRLVALKVLPGGPLTDTDDVRRFHLEAAAIAVLDHPNIVPIYEVGEHDGLSYFAMKLVDGVSLAERLPQSVANPRAAARLVATVARAVHHAHERGVLHRDLKPSNIVIDAEGQPHVTDFGLAKRIEVSSELTQSGAILGTPSYMAPEQASGNRKAITTATDVYGLGAVLYALLTGKPPFKGDSVLETLEQVRQRLPEPPSGVGRDVDRDLETICLKCLEKEPERRYASARELAEDLERWLRGEPIAARPAGSLDRAWRWCRRNPALAVLAVATAASLILLLAVTGIGSLLLWRERGITKRALELERVQRRRAESSAAEADENRRQVVGSMSSLSGVIFRLSSPRWSRPPELRPTRVSLMAAALRLHEQTVKDCREKPALASDLADAYSHLAGVYGTLSAYPKASEMLGKSVAIHETNIARTPADDAEMAQLASACAGMGYFAHLDRQAPAAKEWCRKAIAAFDRYLVMRPDKFAAYNNFAWFLATCPVAELRNPHRAVELARRLPEMLPSRHEGWNTLGVALLRARAPREALVAFQQAMALHSGGDGFDWFFVAMAHQDLGHHAEARRWFDRADRWTVDEWYFHIELRSIRNETAAYLDLPSPSYDDLGRLRDEVLSAPANRSDH